MTLILRVEAEKLKDKKSELMAEAGYPDDEVSGLNETSKMLKDMWKVYRMKGGLKHLKKIIGNDPVAFLDMTKDIMRLEATLSGRNKNNEPQKTVFVILKGLHNEVAETPAGEKVDLKQIGEAMDPLHIKSGEKEVVTSGPIAPSAHL